MDHIINNSRLIKGEMNFLYYHLLPPVALNYHAIFIGCYIVVQMKKICHLSGFLSL